MPTPIQPTGNISALLRLIQEERSQSPTAKITSTDPGTPLREAVQAPLEAPIAPESPGSERTIALRPEGTDAITPGDGSQLPVAPARARVGAIGGPGAVVPPSGIDAPVTSEVTDPRVVPAAPPPPPPTPEPQPGGENGQPQPATPSATPTPAQPAPTPTRSIATSVRPASSPGFIGPTRPSQDALDLVAQIDKTIEEINAITSGARDEEFKERAIRKSMQDRVNRAATSSGRVKGVTTTGFTPSPSPQPQKQGGFLSFLRGLGTRLRSFF